MIELLAGQAELRGRPRLVATRVAQGAGDQRPFHRAHLHRRHLHRLAGRCNRQVLGRDEAAVGEDRGPLEHVAQLPHVARPAVREQRRLGLVGDAGRCAAERAAEFIEELRGERDDVFGSLPQRRQVDVEHLQAVEQVLAEVAALHGGAQVAIGRGNDPHVRLHRSGAAEPGELPLLQHAQQLDLRRRRHLAHLVEQQHAAGRHLDLAGLALVRAREGAALVPEQFRLEQVFRQRRAVDGDERAGAPRRDAMDVARDHLLAGARFASDQHRRVGCGHLRRAAQHLRPGRRLPHHVGVAGTGVEGLGKRLHPGLQPLRARPRDGRFVRGCRQLFVRHAERDVQGDVAGQGHVGLRVGMRTLGPEVQYEPLVGGTDENAERRPVPRLDHPGAVVGRLDGGRLRRGGHQVVDDLEPPVLQAADLLAADPHEEWPVVVRECVCHEGPLLVVQRHRQAVVRQRRLHQRRHLWEHVTDVEDRPDGAEQRFGHLGR